MMHMVNLINTAGYCSQLLACSETVYCTCCMHARDHTDCEHIWWQLTLGSNEDKEIKVLDYLHAIHHFQRKHTRLMVCFFLCCSTKRFPLLSLRFILVQAWRKLFLSNMESTKIYVLSFFSMQVLAFSSCSLIGKHGTIKDCQGTHKLI